MIAKDLLIPYFEYDWAEFNDLPAAKLFPLAEKAADQAYAPYSGFHVGVAIELSDGTCYTASNQENKAYPSGTCAERAGIFYVQANHPDIAIRRIFLIARQNGEMTSEPVYPCGACRQVMVETQERQRVPIEVWMAGRNRIHRVDSCEYLLPLKFEL